MPKFTISASKISHLALWSTAILYLLLSPSLYYHLFPREGKPIEVWEQQPKEAGRGRFRYNVESTKFWSNGKVTYAEGETYALWGWAFLNKGPDTLQADFDRFVIIYDDANSYVFPMQVYRRPGVQKVFKKLGLKDLKSSGFYSVISRNALDVGEYGIGLLFKHKQNGSIYYVQTNKILVRSPNHLTLKSISK
jgi:hypothetical protein